MRSDNEKRKKARRTEGEGVPAGRPDVREEAARRGERHLERKSGRLVERARSAREVSGSQAKSR